MSEAETRESAVRKVIEEVIPKGMTIFDFMRSAPSGDYFAHVQMMRFFQIASSDLEFLKKLSQEMQEKMEASGYKPDNDAISEELGRRDGARRMIRLNEITSEAFRTNRSLLTGENFDECLDQYKRLLEHVEKTWSGACGLFLNGNHPLAAFTAILVIEEVGKLSRLKDDLMHYDSAIERPNGEPVMRDHRKKHFIGVMSGAVINSRLDRILGKGVIRKILNQAENNELERIRQNCLYIDIVNGRAVSPHEVVDVDLARTLCILAGELMAETLGFFPWEFERMIAEVSKFEIAVGIPEEKLKR
ncbi:AbiV family abortive infection protein [Rhizobium lentis]|uniref:AbiV family abortive infection protein n=1 Tax=Rhizobium lentis TaxID=1138194 RepID=UPI001C83F91F|nr:AbiV family abortive infection protein [Rhizobium lentis]MBX5111942.1 AbiV family abortive infection protein [Rhizobium lentis]